MLKLGSHVMFVFDSFISTSHDTQLKHDMKLSQTILHRAGKKLVNVFRNALTCDVCVNFIFVQKAPMKSE